MIHKINMLFIIFNTILLFFFFKQWDKMNNTKELYTTTPVSSISSVTTVSGGEDYNTNCIYNRGTSCNYDASIPTNNRTECLNKCKLNTNCTSKDCYYRCFDDTCSTWTGPNICNFIPYGATLSKCTSTCIENDGCNYSSCDDICSNCESEKDCLWYKKKINEEEIFIKENIPVNIDPTRPLPPTIFVTVKKDGVVNVKFNPPFSINNTTPNTSETPKTPTTSDTPKTPTTSDTPKTPNTSETPTTTTSTTSEIKPTFEINTGLIDTTINSFMYVVYKTQDKTGGIRIGTYYITDDDSIRVKRNKYNTVENKGKIIPIIEFDIENLDKDTFYNIGIRSYRDSDRKISPLSNIFTVIPNKEKKNSVPKLTYDDKGGNTSNLSVNYTPHVCSPEGT